jgi:hypothetical protein
LPGEKDGQGGEGERGQQAEQAENDGSPAWGVFGEMLRGEGFGRDGEGETPRDSVDGFFGNVGLGCGVQILIYRKRKGGSEEGLVVADFASRSCLDR